MGSYNRPYDAAADAKSDAFTEPVIHAIAEQFGLATLKHPDGVHKVDWALYDEAAQAVFYFEVEARFKDGYEDRFIQNGFPNGEVSVFFRKVEDRPGEERKYPPGTFFLQYIEQTGLVWVSTIEHLKHVFKNLAKTERWTQRWEVGKEVKPVILLYLNEGDIYQYTDGKLAPVAVTHDHLGQLRKRRYDNRTCSAYASEDRGTGVDQGLESSHRSSGPEGLGLPG